ncbi:Protein TRIGALACTOSYLDIACYLGLYCEROL 1, chloroplastic [Trebouxia sp. C0010 RCD-2024]
MSMLGHLAGTAHLCVRDTPKQGVARHGTASFRPLRPQIATLPISALHQQRCRLSQQLRRKSKAQTSRHSHISCVQAASAAHQQFSNRLSGSGAGGALPRFVNWVNTSKPPKYLWRTLAALLMGGQALVRILQGKVHKRNTLEQLKLVGPNTVSVALLTAAFVGMVFTIQFVREFAKLGLTRSVGGVLALALSRELTPVVTCIIMAGRVGSAFAAELGTMQVSEQTDSLRVLGTDPVDYLVSPRVLACMIAGPVLNILCFAMGLAASVGLAETVYGVSANVILDSACRAITSWDIVTSCIKSWVFGTIIAVATYLAE